MEEKARNRFRKPCRLHHKTLVDSLFSEGEGLYAYPLRVVGRRVSSEQLAGSFSPGFVPRVARVQMLVAIPKRKLHRAVDRVLMRRRIREAYRHLFPAFEEKVRLHDDIATLSVGIVYISSKLESYEQVERKLSALLARLAEKL